MMAWHYSWQEVVHRHIASVEADRARFWWSAFVLCWRAIGYHHARWGWR